MKTVAAVIALALAFPIASHASSLDSITTTPLQEMSSNAGEAKEDFLLRVGSFLQSYTAKTGYEACGLVGAAEGDKFAVAVTTNESHIGCLATAKVAGFVVDKESIHSHPQILHYRVSQVDYVFLSVQNGNTAHLNQMDNIQAENTFSATDYKTGRGYLVTNGKLLYQYGKQYPVREVGEVK